MLIEDKSVTVPLTIFCGCVAAFVLLMYIMVPFGALFTLWGRDYSLSLKWFQYMFKTSGLKAFKAVSYTHICDDGGDAAGRGHSDDIPRGGERVSDLRVQQL